MSNIEIKDAEENVCLPKKKDIFAGNEKVGEITPSISYDQLDWHACIKMCDCVKGIGLAQGHGPEPHKAVFDALDDYQKQIDQSIKTLADMKAKLGLE